jgi:DNA-binding response OmpR family regulator
MSRCKGIRLLSICDDDGIRFSRDLVLRHEGYEVESIASGEVLDPARIRSFHIAVLCHSLSPSRAAEIASILRRSNPAISVLRVHAIRSAVDHSYDVDCEVLPGPGQLLDAVKTLAMRFQVPHQEMERKRA